jgi:hypothetical protein
VVGIVHDRVPSHDIGSMWLFLLTSRKWHEYEIGWRIPDGKGGEWIIFMFGALKVVAST